MKKKIAENEATLKWKAERKADTLDLFSNLPHDIQKKIIQHHEPSTKAEYIQYYSNILSVKKEFSNLVKTRIEEKSCKNPISIYNIMEAITKDVKSMMRNHNTKWNLNGCLSEIKGDLMISVISYMNTVKQLKTLFLKNNSITRLPPNFGTSWNLTLIDLSDNTIESLPDTFGIGWLNLKYIYLNNNQLTSLPERFGNSWTHLNTIDLHYNKLTSLPETFGDTWTNLTEVHLGDNNLTCLPETFGEKWTRLTTIDLNNNELTHLPDTFGKAWTKLKYIDFDFNEQLTFPETFGNTWPKNLDKVDRNMHQKFGDDDFDDDMSGMSDDSDFDSELEQ